MRYHWEVEVSDAIRVRQVVAERSRSGLVTRRIRENLSDERPVVTRARLWGAMVAALLTSQQRSGPDDPVTRFLNLRPFPFDIAACDAEKCLSSYVQAVLQGQRGIRFRKTKLPKFLHDNLPLLTGHCWDECGEMLEYLRQNVGLDHERLAANFFDDRFKGIGPKQARNVIQMLGLTRYVVPIDSRVVGWMKGIGFPVSGGGLGDRGYYEFLEDGLQVLCRACEVYPCILDAAVFASRDTREWTNEESMW